MIGIFINQQGLGGATHRSNGQYLWLSTIADEGDPNDQSDLHEKNICFVGNAIG